MFLFNMWCPIQSTLGDWAPSGDSSFNPQMETLLSWVQRLKWDLHTVGVGRLLRFFQVLEVLFLMEEIILYHSWGFILSMLIVHWFIPDFRGVSHYLRSWNSLLYKLKFWGQRLDTVKCSLYISSEKKKSMHEVFLFLLYRQGTSVRYCSS